ncbi:MAG: putative thiol:disulfide interchange protein DsbC precursor [Pseudomonadota bacterium]|jgi:thiol:disulfide interchange protein DsbC
MTFAAPRRFLRSTLAAVALGVCCLSVTLSVTWAQDTKVDAAVAATIRKNLGERLPNLPKIDDITKTPMPGLFEVRVNGADLLYTDADGNYLIQGMLIDTKSKTNLTEERVEKLTAIPFSELPLKDAFTIVRGNGKRKLAVFEDPNCGYCKRFERDLAKVDNVTVYVFLYPILGQNSVDKSKAIWCAKDKSKAFLDWMIKDQALPTATNCDTAALDRNVEFGKKYRITGTPALFFVDGSRVPGAISSDRVEKLLSEAKQP